MITNSAMFDWGQLLFAVQYALQNICDLHRQQLDMPIYPCVLHSCNNYCQGYFHEQKAYTTEQNGKTGLL